MRTPIVCAALTAGLLWPADAGATAYLYAWGRGTTGSNQVYKATAAGGSISGWVNEANYPISVNETWGVVDGNDLYSFAGNSSGWVADVNSSPIGFGGVLAGWTSTSPLSAPCYQPVVMSDAGWVYAFTAGCGNAAWSASIGGGAVGGWSNQGAIPVTGTEAAGIELGGYAFLFGGTSVYSASLGGGAVGSWSAEPPVPAGGIANFAASGLGAIFIAGGLGNPNGIHSAVPVAGTIPGWSSQTSFPINPNYEFALVYADGYLWLIGGQDPPGSWQSWVYSAPVSGGGTVGTWTSQSNLPVTGIEWAAAAWEAVNTTPSPTPTATRTRTPTRTPTIQAVNTPTCAIPNVTVTPPYLLVNRNVFDPERERLEILWAVTDPSNVQIRVYNSAGEFIRALELVTCGAGTLYRGVWDGRNYQDRVVGSGVYVLRLVTLGAKSALTARVAVGK